MIQSPRGMSIMEAYELYRKNSIFVNRKYQRKLVWTVKEKQNLVESILKKYPVPLILLAETQSSKFEIIDGMQRLNALFGFIENQFPILKNGEELYFRVKDYTFAQTVADKNVFTPLLAKKYISQEEVAAYISYPFPVTIFESQDEEDINETFRRINANGKHLSPQEVRQAGNTSQLSNIVRKIAAEIRGDTSKEILLLSEMPEISIDSKISSIGYGVIADETFWCKQGILRVSDLRDSDDEQLIVDILLSTILGQPLASSKDELNNYYGTGNSDKSKDLEIKINALGQDNIYQDVKVVFAEIFNFCNYGLKGQRLKNILNPKAGSNPVKEDFYTLFMAFFDLIIRKNKLPFDYDEIINAITDLHSKIPRTSNHASTTTRTKNINLTRGLIENYFKESGNTFRSPSTYIIDFQNYLMKSKVESAVYDYKQGLYDLNPKNRKFSDKAFEEKIIKNIAALANLGKSKKGYIFLGVTDKESDTKQVELLDNLADCPRYYNFGIVGLEREAKFKGVSLDEYISMVTSKISLSDLPGHLKSKVTKALTPITYSGMTVLMIEVECGDEPVYYKDVIYAREGSSCIEIIGAKQAEIFQLFR